MGSSPAHWLLGAFPTLPLSQQSVAVDLPLRLVSVSCLFLYAQVCFLCGCSLCFLNKYKCLVLLPFLCSASSHLQCSVPLCLCLSAFACFWGCLAVPLVCFGSYLGYPGPCRGGGSQQGSSPAYWRNYCEVQAETCIIFDEVNEDPQQMILDRRSKPDPRNEVDLDLHGGGDGTQWLSSSAPSWHGCCSKLTKRALAARSCKLL